MPTWIIAIVSFAYVGVLFAVAWGADRRSDAIAQSKWRPYIYALSLAVYCTSWTFFGAVGTAASQGWNYLPIYLGPAIVLLCFPRALKRLVDAAKRENSTSIADFISSRYGKSHSVAALATILATTGILPYIALQLKSVSMSFDQLRNAADPSPNHFGIGLISALLLAGFSIIFGARRYDASGHNQGLVVAISLESLVKIVALAAVGVMAVGVFGGAGEEQRALGEERLSSLFALDAIAPSFITILLLSMGAIICLPRQFHISVIECQQSTDITTARWLFPFYMVVTTIVVIPITLAGLAVLPTGSPPDLFVLQLPLSQGERVLALFSFIGGVSAATGMVIVETVALSTMISNHLLAPLLLRDKRLAGTEADLGQILLNARRITIIALMLLAYLYYRNVTNAAQLAAIGLLSFAAAVQLAPALVGAILWQRGNQSGARAGLAAGFALWLYTLFIPAYIGPEALDRSGLQTVLGGLINPHGLLGYSGPDHLTHGVFWSLGINCLLYVVVSLLTPLRMRDRLRGLAFVPGGSAKHFGAAKTVGDLLALAERFAGRPAVEQELASLTAGRGQNLRPDDPINKDVARAIERLIAGVIGSASARLIVSSALSRGSLDVVDVVQVLDETNQELQFNRDLLHGVFDNISQAISVIDRDLRLVAWNAQYPRMFDYPPGFLYVGRPIGDIIRYNANHGEYGTGSVDSHVSRLLNDFRNGRPSSYERVRPNGRVLKTHGNPMPGGGYVTSFTDITAEKEAEKALREANEQLEDRVEQRTAMLSKANADLAHEAERNRRLAEALDVARRAAEEADLGKTKFLAAASHDLLQPLNAARLFSTALNDSLKSASPDIIRLARNIDRSITAADRLLGALLDISKLDAGGVTPSPAKFAVGPLIEELVAEFQPIAAAKSLELRHVMTSAWIHTDRALLRSVLQNFLSNAVRYTQSGGILIGCRMRGPNLRIEVCDTGPGIPADKRQEIFQEFRRLDSTRSSEKGVGLGLAIVDRIGRLLSLPIDVRSELGKGSAFSIEVPRAVPAEPVQTVRTGEEDALGRLEVLCLDNEETILEGMQSLLERWGCHARLAATYGDAIAAASTGPVDVAFVDYHLDGPETGIDVLARLKDLVGSNLVGVLITADSSPGVADAARRLGVGLLRKPVDPLQLRAILSTLRRPRTKMTAAD